MSSVLLFCEKKVACVVIILKDDTVKELQSQDITEVIWTMNWNFIGTAICVG